MNKQVRKQLTDVVSSLQLLQDELNDVLEEQNDILDNIPENLQGSEQYERQEEAIDALGNAASYLDDVMQELTNAVNA